MLSGEQGLGRDQQCWKGHSCFAHSRMQLEWEGSQRLAILSSPLSMSFGLPANLQGPFSGTPCQGATCTGWKQVHHAFQFSHSMARGELTVESHGITIIWWEHQGEQQGHMTCKGGHEQNVRLVEILHTKRSLFPDQRRSLCLPLSVSAYFPPQISHPFLQHSSPYPQYWKEMSEKKI